MNLLLRSLRHHLRPNAAVALGVATACAALGGALLVGTSVRVSLRDMALDRLGRITHIIESSRMFDASLARRLAEAAGAEVVPAIIERVTVLRPGGEALALRVTLTAADDAFWRLEESTGGRIRGSAAPSAGESDAATLNHTLARDLGVAVGDEVLVRMPAHGAIPSDSLLGRRDTPVRTIRVPVGRIVEDRGLGRFSTGPSQQASRNIILPLSRVQAALVQSGRVNALLAAAPGGTEPLVAALGGALTPADAGLRIRVDEPRSALVVESEQLVLSESVERWVLAAAGDAELSARRVLTYLANTLRRVGAASTAPDAGASIPYSVVAALDLPEFPSATSAATRAAGSSPEVWLNTWAASRLSASTGDEIELSYYMLNPGGDLRTETRRLRVAGVVSMDGLFADRSLTPEYPGIANARSMVDWDPPFPIDTRAIGPEDEAYWKQYGAAPKAFVRFETGAAMWAPPGNASARFGRLTSLRLSPARTALGAAQGDLERALRRRVTPDAAGLRIRAVREEALAAATPATDFGALFLGFSLFVIVAALMLATLLLRLEMERRAREIGTLRAVGLRPRRVVRLLLTEIACVACAGGAIGAPLAVGYAGLMLLGLRTAWSSAVGTTELRLHVTAADVAIGCSAGVVAGAASAWYSLRRLGRIPVTALLNGRFEAWVPRPGVTSARLRRVARPWFTIAAGVSAAGFAAAGFGLQGPAQAGVFFAAGAACLAAMIGAAGRLLRRAAPGTVGPGAAPVARLALRNLARRPDRSLLTMGLVACAAFVIVAVGASRHAPRFEPGARSAGHGGFALWAETDSPLLYDPGRAEARAAMGLSPALDGALARCDVHALRRRGGDDASCLNLYRPASPTLLGAGPRFVERGGFEFAGSLAVSESERANPWTLLERTFADGAVPVIADANTAAWSLHLKLGDDLVLPAEGGGPLRLRLVATLRGSIFQSELLVSEANLLRKFPNTGGYGVVLVDAPPGEIERVRRLLAAELSDHGLEVRPTRDRIAAFLAVERTYLATFQQLGGLGLLLGMLGVVTVLLRNVLERRGELALLSALGFRGVALQRLLWVESLWLVAAGLSFGASAAALAVAPSVASHPGEVPWLSLAGLLALILLVAAAASGAAVRSALRAAPIAALRGA